MKEEEQEENSERRKENRKSSDGIKGNENEKQWQTTKLRRVWNKVKRIERSFNGWKIESEIFEENGYFAVYSDS